MPTGTVPSGSGARRRADVAGEDTRATRLPARTATCRAPATRLLWGLPPVRPAPSAVASLNRGDDQRHPARAVGRVRDGGARSGGLVRRDAGGARRPGLSQLPHAVPARRRRPPRRSPRRRRASGACCPRAFVREVPIAGGFGPSANEVLRLVEGDNGFFLICHDDVAPDPRAVRILVAELFRSNAGIVGPKLTDWDDPRMLQHVGLGLDRFGEVDPIVEPGEVDQEQHDAVRDVFVLPSACLLVRADLFRALGGFDPSISFHGEDVDLCWRAHLTGARVVVAPDARVRHREQLVERRPDLNHRTLQARHRMRTVATLTGGSRLLGRSIQLVLLTLVELVVGLFTGRFGEALASMRALFGLLPRSGSIIRRRREIRGQRVVPEREVLGLQDRGSSRLTSYLRGKETATFVGADSTVRRWREASFGPLAGVVLRDPRGGDRQPLVHPPRRARRGSVPAVPGQPAPDARRLPGELRSAIVRRHGGDPDGMGGRRLHQRRVAVPHVVADDDVGRRLLPARRARGVAPRDGVPGESGAHRRHGGLRRHALGAGPDVAGRLGRLAVVRGVAVAAPSRAARGRSRDRRPVDDRDRSRRRRGAGRPAAPRTRHCVRGARPGADGGVRARRDRPVRRVGARRGVGDACSSADRGGSRDG